jgi:hypothetical protein
MVVNAKKLKDGVFILILLPLVLRFFTDNFGLPYSVNMVIDIYATILLMNALYIKRRAFNRNIPKIIFAPIIVLIAGIFIGLFLNHASITNIFFSIRPYFRLICAFFIAAICLDDRDYIKLYCLIKFLIYINVPIMLIQFFVVGLRQDIVGGTFGNTQGVNSIQNLLCVIAFAFALIQYLDKRIKGVELFKVSACVILIAALAEITAFFVEAIIIIFIALVGFNTTRMSTKKLVRFISLIVFTILVIIVGIKAYLKINPERAFLLSRNGVLEYLGAFQGSSGSTGVYRISRVNVFGQLTNEFFSAPFSSVFGMGLGNASSRSYFYSIYEPILKYDWLSSAITFLETGYWGVLSLAAFVLTIIISSKRTNENKTYKLFSRVMCVISVILFFYNSTTRDYYTAFLLGISMACGVGRDTRLFVK